MKEWKWFAAVVWMTASLTSQNVHAWRLGNPQSHAFLGEALRVTLPLTLANDVDQDDDGCPQASVMYGDQRVDAGKVILRVSPQSGPRRTLTIRAIQAIDEPLIDVKLSYGCTQPVTHQFTIFANPPEFKPDLVVNQAAMASTHMSPTPVSGPSRRGGAVALADAMNGITTVRDHTPRAVTAVPRQQAPVAPRAQPASPSATSAKPVTPESVAPLPEPQIVQAVAAPKVDASAAASSPDATHVEAAPPRTPSVVLKPVTPPELVVPKLVLDPIGPMVMGLPGSGGAQDEAIHRATFAAMGAQDDLIRMQAQLIQDRQRLDDMEKLVMSLREQAVQKMSSGGMPASVPLSDVRHPAWLLTASAVAALFALSTVYLAWRLRRQSRTRAWWAEEAST